MVALANNARPAVRPDMPFSEWQVKELDRALPPDLVSERKGASGRTLSYIEGHDAIAQANRIFGYGNWSSRPVSLECKVITDPLTGEALGVQYEAEVEVIVKGAIKPITDVGSHPVAAWSLEEQMWSRRYQEARTRKEKLDESEFTPMEKRQARAVIMEAHEQARKSAVTDALKRALRAYGEQFGNGLYGKR